MMCSSLSNNARNRLCQLSALSVPVLPSGTSSLLNYLSKEDITFKELASGIENFPVIAGKLISLANSAWSAPVAEILNLEAACSRLGIDVVKSASIAIMVSSSFSPAKCPSFDPDKYWCSALLTAELASRVAAICFTNSIHEPSTARTAGLLHNLGLLWLADQLPAEVDQALLQAGKDQDLNVQQSLINLLDFDHAQASGFLAIMWQLPGPLVSALKHYLETGYQGTDRDLVLTIGLASRLASIILKGDRCTDDISNLAGPDISQEKLETVIAEQDQLVLRIQAAARIFA